LRLLEILDACSLNRARNVLLLFVVLFDAFPTYTRTSFK